MPDMPDKEQRWTLGRGLMTATRTLAVRTAVVVVLWGAMVWVLTPWLNELPMRGIRQSGRVFGIFALPAFAVAWFMAWRLVEAAGFHGWPVAVLGVAFTLAAVLGGVLAAGLLRPLDGDKVVGVLFTMCTFPPAWMAWKTMMDS